MRLGSTYTHDDMSGLSHRSKSQAFSLHFCTLQVIKCAMFALEPSFSSSVSDAVMIILEGGLVSQLKLVLFL